MEAAHGRDTVKNKGKANRAGHAYSQLAPFHPILPTLFNLFTVPILSSLFILFVLSNLPNSLPSTIISYN
jgi:hypothetical protein